MLPLATLTLLNCSQKKKNKVLHLEFPNLESGIVARFPSFPIFLFGSLSYQLSVVKYQGLAIFKKY